MVPEVPCSALLPDPLVPSRTGLRRAAAGTGRGGAGAPAPVTHRRTAPSAGGTAARPGHHGAPAPPRPSLPPAAPARWLGLGPLRGGTGKRESKQRKGKIRRREKSEGRGKKNWGIPNFPCAPSATTGGPQVPWFPLASSPCSNCVFQLSSRAVTTVKFHCTLSTAFQAAIPTFFRCSMRRPGCLEQSCSEVSTCSSGAKSPR